MKQNLRVLNKLKAAMAWKLKTKAKKESVLRLRISGMDKCITSKIREDDLFKLQAFFFLIMF